MKVEKLKMLKGMEGVMLNEVGGGKKELVCAQLSCGDPQVGLLLCPQIFLSSNWNTVEIFCYYQSTLASCLHSGDLTTFTAVLADVAPLEVIMANCCYPVEEGDYGR